ncbi:hypothetical protein [Saccharomonospora cyanea]|uniref:Uncharacterized protein n=1 Tax=Saccharomonospora cyanea NA-134 TaxID=882082 RepID=H5XM99_9PSEU|nr:hypothetical protein [Saccharomonospora cyanea]EHR63650.1 hypothetical protein SaccyDRAFT_4848 [Saccharomonospora cyanea NA-134]
MATTDKGLEAVVNEVYGVDPGEFVRERDRHAAQARERGEKDLAEKIRRLRKPTKAAALVNRLARHHADEVAVLPELGDRLREAHRQLAGDRLRELTHERNKRVAALVELACSPAGGSVGESIRQEIAATLQAAVGDEEAARAVVEGHLVSALSPPDVFESDWLPTDLPSTPTRRDGSASRPGRTETPRPAEPPAPSTREPTVSRRDNERVEAERRRRDAEVRARRVRDEARRELRAAEREEAKAHRRTEAARAALEAAERQVRRYTR